MVTLKTFCVVTFLHSENGRHKFSVNSVFQTFLLVQFSPSPILRSFQHGCVATLKTFLCGDLSALRQWETQIFCQFSFPNFSIGSVFPVTHPRFCFNMDVWLCLKHFHMVTFLHSENGRHKFSVNSVFQTFLLVQFSPSPILRSFQHGCVATLKTFLCGDLSALRQWETQIFCQFSFPNVSIGSVFPVTHPRFCFNMDVWLRLKHFRMVTFLHSENGRHKFSVDSVFQTFLLVQFSSSPILGLFHHLCVATHKTFMCGHLCMVTFLHQ